MKKTLFIVLGFVAVAIIAGLIFGLLTNSKEFVKEPTGKSTIRVSDKSFDVTTDSFPRIVNKAFENTGLEPISEEYQKEQMDYLISSDDSDEQSDYSIDWYIYKNDDIYILLGVKDDQVITIEVFGEYDKKELEGEYYKAICDCIDPSFDCDSFLRNRLIANHDMNGVYYRKVTDVIRAFDDIKVYELCISIDDEEMNDMDLNYIPGEMIDEDW